MKCKVIFLFVLIYFSAKSQESLLSKEIKFVKSQALLQRFETVQEDTVLISSHSPFTLTSDVFEKGNTYYWVLFAVSGSDCVVRLTYAYYDSSSNKPLEAVANSSENIQRLEYTFHKTNDIEIKLEAEIERGKEILLYSILCKKIK